MRKLCRTSAGTDPRIEKIRRLARRIRRETKPSKIILFGSFARGDYNDASDVDLLVIGDFTDRFLDRTGRILALGDGSIDIDALAYTKQELKRLIREQNPLITRALKEGITL